MNYQFVANDKNGIKNGDKNYIYKIGKKPILLSSPHAVKQWRENQIKPSDFLAGPLVMYLALKCNCSYFVRTYNDLDDPNYPVGRTLKTVQNEYLLALKELLSSHWHFLVIDMHGCTDAKKCDLSIWSDNFKTCNKEIINTFEDNLKKYDITLDLGSEYLGGQVTRQCSFITNAIQMEIKKRIRSTKLENYYILKSFIDYMESTINEINEYSIKMKPKRN